VVFPVHPRTRKMLQSVKVISKQLKQIEPLSYLEFIHLIRHAKAVITDSGGVTEETTVLGIPCLTLRDTTERPETLTIGTNRLIGTDPSRLQSALDLLFSGAWPSGKVPEKWDGRSGKRIVAELENLLL
jgi:UDP-N-acetylglucosamine 2-epimerase (non-hydrolysing)